ncbi:hypothetical protein WICPIJ_004882 [Wickerhamomyces pijperi]|uniref:Uncharacterized protein n=1 Tax=Wickerhamomyces pijperi TaxID=599730 RepID=A0A9P8Q4L0_WICPI|nr:hypothetical protein WICPIJ_004882 [Wickerhamomyces pijperi]
MSSMVKEQVLLYLAAILCKTSTASSSLPLEIKNFGVSSSLIIVNLKIATIKTKPPLTNQMYLQPRLLSLGQSAMLEQWNLSKEKNNQVDKYAKTIPKDHQAAMKVTNHCLEDGRNSKKTVVSKTKLPPEAAADRATNRQ